MCEWNQDTVHVYAYDMTVWLTIQVTEYMYRGYTHILHCARRSVLVTELNG